MYSIPHRSRINNYFPAGYPSPTDISELERVISNSTYQGGHGYLAGSFPGGITSVEGAPASATIRALIRLPGYPADGEVAAEVQSSQDGTWIITNLNENLCYDVVGRKDGFNDVIVAGVTPTSMVEITYSGAVIENETFTGTEGYIEIVGGIPPYSVAPETPLPSGLFPVVSGRNLIIDGTTGADEVASFDVKVTSSNGAEKIIPLQLVVGFKAPQNLASEVIFDGGVFSVALTWEVTNSTQQVKVYRSATPFDLDDLPEPIATLSGTSTTYTDDDVIEDDHFYYMVTALCEQYTLESEAVAVLVTDGGDPHWDKVVALLHFDGDFTDAGHAVWTQNRGVSISSADYVFGGGSAVFPLGSYIDGVSDDLNFGTGDFTIEFAVKFNAFDSNPTILDNRFGAYNSALVLYHNGLGKFNLLLGSSATIQTDYLSTGNWYWIAICRSEGITKLFVNGVQSGFGYADTNNYTQTKLRFGCNFLGGAQLVGNMDELRITKGVARYTENFTPPTEPFP